MEKDIVERLKEFMENEGKSCSFDPALITPLYVYRMWGGKVPLEEIEEAMNALKYKAPCDPPEGERVKSKE